MATPRRRLAARGGVLSRPDSHYYRGSLRPCHARRATRGKRPNLRTRVLAGALLEACDRVRDAEQRLVEVAHERAPVAVQEEGDEQAAQQLAGRLAQLLCEVGALRRGRAEQGSAAHCGGP